MAKNATSNAFINAKKRKEEMSLLNTINHTDDKIENLFEEQHHHLLSCLEHATDREFIEVDSNMNALASRLLQLKVHSTSEEHQLMNSFLSCCLCCTKFKGVTKSSFDANVNLHNNNSGNVSNNCNITINPNCASSGINIKTDETTKLLLRNNKLCLTNSSHLEALPTLLSSEDEDQMNTEIDAAASNSNAHLIMRSATPTKSLPMADLVIKNESIKAASTTTNTNSTTYNKNNNQKKNDNAQTKNSNLVIELDSINFTSHSNAAASKRNEKSETL